MHVPFDTVRQYLEGRGWVLMRVWKPYRVFERGKSELPILVEVHNRSVSHEDFEYIKSIAD